MYAFLAAMRRGTPRGAGDTVEPAPSMGPFGATRAG